MRAIASLFLVGYLVAACASQGAKDAFERYASSRVGRLPSDAFKDLHLECGERSGEFGCLRTDFRDCEVWYVVDQGSGRIVSWRYEGKRENCWTNSGLM